MATLNPVQQAAVEHVQGPLLILAGAGSGKTRVLTHRIAHLLRAGHARPYEILAVTFTNKAAKELKERLDVLLQADDIKAYGMWVGTFHSICARILREDIELLGDRYRRNFVIYDDSEQLTVIKDGLARLGLDDKAYPPRSVLSAISRAKSHGQDVERYQAEARGHTAQAIGSLYAYYQQELVRQNALDFDDLLLLAVRLFRAAPDVLDKYRKRFKHVLVDEYQDTNQTQYQLVSLLASGHHNLCVVGDVDQSIYSFRAADFRIILQFQQDFPDAKVVTLVENYRSTGRILQAANAVIENNAERYPKELWTNNPEGEKLVVYEAEDERGEASWVVEQIRGPLRQEGYGSEAIAVLYRTNAQSRAIEDELMRWGIPYRLIGGTRFYDRREIKDAMAYLRLAFNPSDDSAFCRIANVPRRGLGATSLGKLEEVARERGISMLEAALGEVPTLGPKPRKTLADFAAWLMDWHRKSEDLSVHDTLARMLDESGLLPDYRRDTSIEGRARVENLEELVTGAHLFSEESDDPSLGAFLLTTALVSDADQAAEGEAVTLMTLHSAKGLEFPVVFLVGMEEGLFPHKRTLDHPDEIEEERRICYVGITRAEERLFLSHAGRRMLFGQSQFAIPSRFLSELPEDLVRTITRVVPDAPRRARIRQEEPWLDEGLDVTWSDDSGIEEARGRSLRRAPSKPPAEVSAPFAMGDRVAHPAFGHGVVARIIGSGERVCLAVSFPGLGQKILDLRFAPLERLD
ncbi:UvrD-helicase domain-containing protein [bacterium]|nr:UvrD-helicase domain-containing protein [bacterium]